MSPLEWSDRRLRAWAWRLALAVCIGFWTGVVALILGLVN